LWSGNDLITDSIITRHRVIPAERIAFIEYEIKIKNEGNRINEALYIFQLSENSVASAMSLWVNGIEQNSYVTNKCKADSAYTTIVGVENRDPALVSWQEGNKVTLNVFPCTKNEDRRVKIGFTIPLEEWDGKLIWAQPVLKGPNMEKAYWKNYVSIVSPRNLNLRSTISMKEIGDGDYSASGKYVNLVDYRIDSSPLSKAVFSFDSNTYYIEPYTMNNVHTFMDAILLDVNSGWTSQEIDDVLKMELGNRCFILKEDALINIHTIKRDELKMLVKANAFSLPPIDQFMKKGKNLLIVTKSTPNGPDFSDLRGTQYLKNIKNQFINRQSQLHVYDLNTKVPSPLYQTLSQFSYINLVKGNLNMLSQYLRNQSFPQTIVNSPCKVFKNSGMRICKQFKQAGDVSTGENHQLRLYNYRAILDNVGMEYMDRNVCENKDLIAMAEKAHIASPVSSLIVLEKESDYKRFDIKNPNSSIGNATLKSAGAVPEPHEWALIVLSIAILLWVRIRL
jgi:XrtN system VIT domain protein